jgi:hypothetical protein
MISFFFNFCTVFERKVVNRPTKKHEQKITNQHAPHTEKRKEYESKQTVNAYINKTIRHTQAAREK